MKVAYQKRFTSNDILINKMEQISKLQASSKRQNFPIKKKMPQSSKTDTIELLDIMSNLFSPKSKTRTLSKKEPQNKNKKSSNIIAKQYICNSITRFSS